MINFLNYIDTHPRGDALMIGFFGLFVTLTFFIELRHEYRPKIKNRLALKGVASFMCSLILLGYFFLGK